MPAIDINRWINNLLGRLRRSRQRQLVLLQGPPSWCDATVEALDTGTIILSNRDLGSAPVPIARAANCLGREAELVVVDLFEGLNPDVLCIAAGLVRSGGVLMLIAPEIDNWDLDTDRFALWQGETRSRRAWFVEYFIQALEQDDAVGVVIKPDAPLPGLPDQPRLQPTPIEAGRTPEQARVLQQIAAWLEKRNAGIALLDADRGRGKSTCLGLLVAAQSSQRKILVTASSRQTAMALLQQAPDCDFIAPDQLMLNRPAADLVVIDEAAMIPQSILHQIVRLYPRLVMATTTGGYEGTGQGFRVRFVERLETERLLHLRLEQPVRWCSDDALEAWINRVLMLDEVPPHATGPASRSEVSYRRLPSLGEPGQAGILSQVYGLLTSAHYRTRPSDLRMLMENPELVPIVAQVDEQIVGAVILNPEGGFDAALCREILYGRRRPRGHLLAQMLTAQAGIAGFAAYRGVRIQRIAVGEPWRRRGIGTGLLRQALDYAEQNSIDYVGASFALDAQTTSFWRQSGFEAAHVSYARGKSSGDHSIAVLNALNPALDDLLAPARQRMRRHLPVWMTQFLQFLDPVQAVALLRIVDYRAELDALERLDVDTFAHGQRGFELCFASLQKFVMQAVAQTAQEPDPLLIEKAIQNRDWSALGQGRPEPGRQQLQQTLRGLVAALLKDCYHDSERGEDVSGIS